jgi:hypothetical protein
MVCWLLGRSQLLLLGLGQSSLPAEVERHLTSVPKDIRLYTLRTFFIGKAAWSIVARPHPALIELPTEAVDKHHLLSNVGLSGLEPQRPSPQ